MRELWWILLVVLSAGLVVLGINVFVSKEGAPIYSTVKEVPAKKAALLLGTSKYIAKGKKNYFYTYRIEAAAALWRAGKIKAIVVSGDNATKYYDETTRMYNDLIKAGVPARYIAKDYAGYRTLDSVMRAKAIFDLEDYIIISQRFHLERALFLAHAKGQKAIGFKAKDIAGTPAAYRMQTREFLAKTKAFLDVYLLDTQPKFYGEKKKVKYKK
ncbi:MAG TPA: ElyC/SanA/YdcF family protein [Sulfurovum sp.]|jgi:SanA protein|nr:MAG: vancomycin resistance protein [Sulfurovum sp. 35-42-20]OYY55677.1 MAG: vancomycin resistance protein [Sulfurovum sp. 28-43-6]OYZ25327.1 MAG: vancomycin resistance protein [Sulfurovum sp. 16-42-52]OYZ49077.1 MAG: vancomycin resistance protein [Sulfurovum sp. 24-42-9]OZA46844.1 MAG: vancomycin resistance protein [Sulfurovum sp. 17-42-90]OZA59187.1 MAG: vancomycin resistance protein [Sulfurovum sp. 39-42-12]HQR74408.1 ElyC/SanA/YdcF family protein [Sulfurovum sp.]